MLVQVSFYCLPCPANLCDPRQCQPLTAGSAFLPAQSIVHQQLLSQGAENTTVRQLQNHFPCLFLPLALSLFALPMEKGKLNYSKMSS